MYKDILSMVPYTMYRQRNKIDTVTKLLLVDTIHNVQTKEIKLTQSQTYYW
jgi:hypothetical protein